MRTYYKGYPIVNKLFPSGAYEISDIIGDTRIHRTYMGYTKRDALALFKQEFTQAQEEGQ